MLPPGKSIEILIKFLTFRDVSYDSQAEPSSKLVKQRNITIMITTSNGGEVYEQHEYSIKPQFPCVDHTFRHYEPENSFFKFTIPPFLQYGDGDFTLEVSNPIAHARIVHETNEIDLQSKTDHALSIFVSNVYVYSDRYHTELLATCRVEVTPLSCMYVKTNAGIDNPLTLSLPAFSAQTVSIYSDQPDMVKIPEDNKFQVSSPHITVTLQTYTTDQRKVIINAVGKCLNFLFFNIYIFRLPYKEINLLLDDLCRFLDASYHKNCKIEVPNG